MPTAFESGQLVDVTLPKDLDGKQRNHADDRAGLEGLLSCWPAQLIVVKTVLIVPKSATDGVYRVDDGHKMVEKLARYILVRGASLGQFECHGHHYATIKRHPCRSIRLFKFSAIRSRSRTVEHADVIQAEKTASEKVFPVGILAVHPPREIQKQLLKSTFEKIQVTLAPLRTDFVHAPGRPGVHRRIDVAESKFVRRQLTVGTHIPLPQKQQQLFLGKCGVKTGNREHVKSEIPSGEPRVLPLVGHGDYIPGKQVPPFVVASTQPLRRRLGLRRIPVQPIPNDVVVELFGTQDTGISLTRHPAFVLTQFVGDLFSVEGIRLANPVGKSSLLSARHLRHTTLPAQPQP